MITKIGWIIDIALILLVLIHTIVGRHRGMVKTLKGLVAPVIAVMLAISLNSAVTAWIEGMTLFDKVEQKVDAVIGEKIGSQEEIEADATNLTEEQKKALKDIFDQFGIDSEEALDAVTEGKTASRRAAVVETVSHTIARAIATLCF